MGNPAARKLLLLQTVRYMYDEDFWQCGCSLQKCCSISEKAIALLHYKGLTGKKKLLKIKYFELKSEDHQEKGLKNLIKTYKYRYHSWYLTESTFLKNFRAPYLKKGYWQC